MGVAFGMGVLPLDDRGEVLYEAVGQPSFNMSDSMQIHLLGQRDRFGALFEGLDMRWFEKPSIDAYRDPRYPTRAECFDRDQILSCVNTILERLLPGDPRIPRVYKIRRLQPGAVWVEKQKVYFDGRVMDVTAGWDSCQITWKAPRTSDEILARLLSGNSEPFDFRMDLRGEEQFACHDVAETPDGPAPGAPMTLVLDYDTPESRYRATLEEIKAFCNAVDPQKYCVFTIRC